MFEFSPLTIHSFVALFSQPPSGFTTADGVGRLVAPPAAEAKGMHLKEPAELIIDN